MLGYLNNMKKFNFKYNIRDVVEENVKKLNSQIKLFILRRWKFDTFKDLFFEDLK